MFGQSGSVTPVPPHHITLLDITVEESITSDNPVGTVLDHAVYFSKSRLLRGTTSSFTASLSRPRPAGSTARSTSSTPRPEPPNANNVTIRHLNVTGD